MSLIKNRETLFPSDTRDFFKNFDKQSHKCIIIFNSLEVESVKTKALHGKKIVKNNHLRLHLNTLDSHDKCIFDHVLELDFPFYDVQLKISR